MSKLSAHELAGHPLVRLIDEDYERDYDDPDKSKAIIEWLDDHRAEGLPLLLKLAGDHSLLRDKALADGDVPIEATYYLERYDDPAVIPFLIDLLLSLPETFPEQSQWHSIWDTLQRFADRVGEVAIQRYEDSTEPKHRTILARLLGDFEIADPRVFDILVNELPTSPCLISTYLAERGDDRALPALLAAFDDCKHTDCGEFGGSLVGQPMFDICDAVGTLSGHLSWAQWQRYERAWTARTPKQPTPSLVPPSRRTPETPRLSELPPVMIGASTLPEFCQNGLLVYGSVRNATRMMETPAARLWHLAYYT